MAQPQGNGIKATPGHISSNVVLMLVSESDLTSYRSEDFQIYVRGFSRGLYVSCRLPKKSSKSFKTFCTIK